MGAGNPEIYLLLVIEKKGDRLRIDSSVIEPVCTNMKTQVRIPRTHIKKTERGYVHTRSLGTMWVETG